MLYCSTDNQFFYFCGSYGLLNAWSQSRRWSTGLETELGYHCLRERIVHKGGSEDLLIPLTSAKWEELLKGV